MTTDTTHNGWTNYETWNAKLWIDNDQGSAEYWQEIAQECYDQSKAERTFTREQTAALDLAERLKGEFDTDAELPELPGFYADILNAALSSVNWYEIARNMIDNLA